MTSARLLGRSISLAGVPSGTLNLELNQVLNSRSQSREERRYYSPVQRQGVVIREDAEKRFGTNSGASTEGCVGAPALGTGHAVTFAMSAGVAEPCGGG